MKNKFAIILAVAILFAVILGCSSANPFSSKSNNKTNSNQTLTEKAIDSAVPDGVVGIPECDEVMKMLTDIVNNPDDNFAEKAAKRVFANRIKDGLKQAVDVHKGDKAEMAKTCKAVKFQVQKFKQIDGGK